MKTMAVCLLAMVAIGCQLMNRTDDPDLAFESEFDRMEQFLTMISGDWESQEAGTIAAVHIARLPEFGKAFYTEEIHRDGRVRQWVYMVEKSGPDYVARTWQITRPGEFVDAWKNESKLAEMSMYYLRAQSECDVAFRWKDGAFIGETVAGRCTGLVQNETEYVTTRIAFNETTMNYYAQGSDAKGARIWGTKAAEKLKK